MRLLEARLAEFQDGAVPSTPPQQPNDSVDITIQSGDPLQPSQPHPQPPQAQAPGRRTRWFQVQLPRITLEDGSQVTPHSLEELKELLRSRGLTPHPRGDAPMLLWQVRNRLGGTVEAVAI